MQANELAIIQRHLEQSKLFQYEPYDWQRDFHNAGKDIPERMLMAANRVGKTQCCAHEMAMHLTGRYPEWWQGKRFDEPIRAWAGSPTNLTSRDIQQKALLGGTGSLLGTGTVPKRTLIGKPKKKQAGVQDVVDYVSVKHISGGESQCVFKTYDQGWRTWQGEEPEAAWLDEEPSKGGVPNSDDYKIFSEAQTRILTSNGVLFIGFTPLYGATQLVRYFQEGRKGTYLQGATWEQAPHLDKQARKDLEDRYQDYERDTRTLGIPMMGEGRVFPMREEEIKVDPFEIPLHWTRICGIDFGMDHPAAAAWLAHDRDTDIFYLYDSYKKANETTAYHAEAIKRRGLWIPVAWPHDGMDREKQGGQNLYRQYQNHGVKMLPHSARYEPDRGGSQPVNPIVDSFLERMITGRFRAFRNQNDFFDEFRNYHRKDGVIVAIRDDIMKATFYAGMMVRYAITKPRNRNRHSTVQPIRAHL